MVVAPLTEEAAKGLFILLLLLYRRAELDGILDGIVYAGMVGIGFAFTENILYLSQAYIGDDSHVGGIEGAVSLFVVRGVFSPFAHPFFTAFIGIGLGIAVSSRRKAVRVGAPLLGYALAVCAHALWNASLLIDGGSGAVATYFVLMVPAFLLMVGFAVWARRREGILLAAALTDCARRGFLAPARGALAGADPGAPQLPPQRRGGGRGGRAGRDGALPGRGDRAGVPAPPVPAGHAAGELPRARRAHVQQMAGLRPHLIWPASPGRPGGWDHSGVSGAYRTGMSR